MRLPCDLDPVLGLIPFNLIGFIGGIILFGFANFLIEMISGSSLGKKILKLQVGNEDGTKGSVTTFFIRTLLKNISTPFSILTIITGFEVFNTIGTLGAIVITIGCFFVLGEAMQAFHDRIAKTAVYKRDQIIQDEF